MEVLDFFQLVSSTIADWPFALIGVRIVGISFDVVFVDNKAFGASIMLFCYCITLISFFFQPLVYCRSRSPVTRVSAERPT